MSIEPEKQSQPLHVEPLTKGGPIDELRSGIWALVLDKVNNGEMTLVEVVMVLGNLTGTTTFHLIKGGMQREQVMNLMGLNIDHALGDMLKMDEDARLEEEHARKKRSLRGRVSSMFGGRV